MYSSGFRYAPASVIRRGEDIRHWKTRTPNGPDFGSLIGMGSVVLREVPPNSVMVGDPARKLRDNKA